MRTRRRSPRFARRGRRRHLRVRERAGARRPRSWPRARRSLPAPRALPTTQDRLTEKSFIAGLGIPTAPFRGGRRARPSSSDAVAEIGRPAVLKTRRFGYDGKGQAMIRAGHATSPTACAAIGARACDPRGLRAFEREVSVVAARGRGRRRSPPIDLCENEHATTSSTSRACRPGSIRDDRAARPSSIAARIAEALDYVGVLAVEMFVVREDGRERWSSTRSRRGSTIPATGPSRARETSQFEQHVRAVCRLAARLHAPGAAGSRCDNLIGDEVDALARLLAEPGAASAPLRQGRGPAGPQDGPRHAGFAERA